VQTTTENLHIPKRWAKDLAARKNNWKITLEAWKDMDFSCKRSTVPSKVMSSLCIFIHCNAIGPQTLMKFWCVLPYVIANMFLVQDYVLKFMTIQSEIATKRAKNDNFFEWQRAIVKCNFYQSSIQPCINQKRSGYSGGGVCEILSGLDDYSRETWNFLVSVCWSARTSWRMYVEPIITGYRLLTSRTVCAIQY
jgi:hypothetical protein